MEKNLIFRRQYFLPDDLSYRWLLNEFPVFITMDKRRFVSQTNGNLYIANVEASDKGNYSCFVSSPSITKSVFSKFIPLIPLPERKCFLCYTLLLPVVCLWSACSNEKKYPVGRLAGYSVRANRRYTFWKSWSFLSFFQWRFIWQKCPKMVEFGLVSSSSENV